MVKNEGGVYTMNLIVIGPKGKMGKLIVKVASSRKNMKLLYGIGPKGRDYINGDLGIDHKVIRILQQNQSINAWSNEGG